MANDNALKVEMLVVYQKCMHNHAASSRGFLLDGCGLFEAPSGTTAGSREAMFCAVCGCHRNYHQRVAVEIPQHYHSSRSSSASHPHQQQQPASYPHQQQQPASHPHHNHRGGRGTMIIRREPASAPGRFAPEQAAARRQTPAASPALTTTPATRRVHSRAPHRHAEGTSAARQGVPPQHGVRATRAKRITRAQTEMVRALTERNNWKKFREYSQAEVLRICSDFGITTLSLRNCISSLHRRRRKAAIAAIDQH
ncbi:hypothetical protein ABFX02_02G072000 [Erythranthe guttata]